MAIDQSAADAVAAILSQESVAPEDRKILADALADAGRALESRLAGSDLPVRLAGGRVLPELEVQVADFQEGYMNCRWGRLAIGGCYWSAADGHWSDSGEPKSAGDLRPYHGNEMTGGAQPDAEYFRAEARLDLAEAEAEELADMLRRESRRVCRLHLGTIEADAIDAVVAVMTDPQRYDRRLFRAGDGTYYTSDSARWNSSSTPPSVHIPAAQEELSDEELEEAAGALVAELDRLIEEAN